GRFNAQRTVYAVLIETGQSCRIAVDVLAQLGAMVADVLGIDEHGGDAGADHRRLEGADTRYFQLVDQIAGREHRATLLSVIRRIEELQHDFRRRERSEEHTSELSHVK